MTKCWNDTYAFKVMSGSICPDTVAQAQMMADVNRIATQYNGPAMPDAVLEFVDECESGKGWSACSQFCASNATFTCQATDALPGPPITGCDSLGGYCHYVYMIHVDAEGKVDAMTKC